MLLCCKIVKRQHKVLPYKSSNTVTLNGSNTSTLENTIHFDRHEAVRKKMILRKRLLTNNSMQKLKRLTNNGHDDSNFDNDNKCFQCRKVDDVHRFVFGNIARNKNSAAYNDNFI